MVVSSTLARPYPLVAGEHSHFSSSDLSDIEQGLKEISEGKVIPLSHLEKQFGMGKDLS